MLAGHIYLVTNKLNGKQYVGCTSQSVEKRWGQHVRASRRGSSLVLHQAIRKYGAENFSVEPLKSVEGSRRELLSAEQHEVGARHCMVPKGYNVVEGGSAPDFSSPSFRARHLEGIRKRSAKPEWRDVLQKRSEDPHWKEANRKVLQKLHTDPTIRKAQREGVRRRLSDPEYLSEQVERTKRTTTSEKWKKAHKEGILKRSGDPSWREAQLPKLQKAWAANSRKALEKDALRSPEERAWRQRRREDYRRYRRRKKERLCSQ